MTMLLGANNCHMIIHLVIHESHYVMAKRQNMAPKVGYHYTGMICCVCVWGGGGGGRGLMNLVQISYSFAQVSFK